MMKYKNRTQPIFVLALLLLLSSCGGKTIDGEKNIREITVVRELPFDKQTIWERIFMDYGNVYKFNPAMKNSGYIGDLRAAVVGAERFVENTDGGKVFERIIAVDQEEHKMRFKIFDTNNVPLDTEVSFGESSLEEIGPNKTLFKLKFQYRTSPKIVALFAHGTIKKDLQNMTIGIEHYLSTNEVVTEANFDQISTRYKKN